MESCNFGTVSVFELHAYVTGLTGQYFFHKYIFHRFLVLQREMNVYRTWQVKRIEESI